MANNSKNAAVWALDVEPELRDIFWRLENEEETPQLKRVSKILGLLSALGKGSKAVDDLKAAGLRHLLGQYRWRTRALISRAKEGYRPILIREPEKANPSRDDKWEYDAVTALLDIAGSPGALARLRQCGNAECGRWLFTPKGKPRQFCADLCKQHAFDSKPGQREIKRKYMKKLREDAEKHRLNPKSGVGLKRTHTGKKQKQGRA